MSKLRKLVKGDRVRITGPWCIDTDGDCGEDCIGKFATVDCVEYDDDPDMPINLLIDGMRDTYWWCRENLRALPRKGAAK